MYGIGEMSRRSGLSVSALRFYDSVGVLSPAWVDPRSGYRWFAPSQVTEARVVARLRRVGMPLEQVRLVVNRRGRPELVEQVLSGHLRRLEAGLVDARRELSTVRELLADQELTMTSTATPVPAATPTRVTVTGDDLAAALAAVRHAASADAELPMLCGVLLDIERDRVSAVASDRYRLAIACAAVSGVSGPPVQVITPLPLVDAVVAVLSADTSPVTVHVDGDQISVDVHGGPLRAQRLGYDFPHYRQVVPPTGAHEALVDVARLRSELRSAPVRRLHRDQDGVAFDAAAVAVDATGAVTLTPTGDPAVQVWVNRDFLLQALDAGGATQLLLELDGPAKPLAIRDPWRADHFALLMPTRLD